MPGMKKTKAFSERSALDLELRDVLSRFDQFTVSIYYIVFVSITVSSPSCVFCSYYIEQIVSEVVKVRSKASKNGRASNISLRSDVFPPLQRSERRTAQWFTGGTAHFAFPSALAKIRAALSSFRGVFSVLFSFLSSSADAIRLALRCINFHLIAIADLAYQIWKARNRFTILTRLQRPFDSAWAELMDLFCGMIKESERKAASIIQRTQNMDRNELIRFDRA